MTCMGRLKTEITNQLRKMLRSYMAAQNTRLQSR